MITTGNADYFNSFFHYILLGVLLFSSVAFLFIFVINWDDWFFGLKVEGFSAGILLFAKFLISAILVWLLVRFPERISWVAGISLVFFGFLLTDSLVTISQNAGNMTYFRIVPVVFTLIPAIVLIGRNLLSRQWLLPNSENRDPIISPRSLDIHERYNVGNWLMLASAGIVLAMLTGPAIFSMVFFHMNSNFSPQDFPGKTCVLKVNAQGITEWQTQINGFSNFPLSVTQSSEGDFIIAGMFKTSGQQDASLRILKLNARGITMWDIRRGVFAYPETNLGALQTILPTAEEFTVIMADGFVIRLDAQGNELWHRDYPDTLVHTSISRSDGGYFLIGDAHEGSSSEPGWKKFDGWILNADRKGNIVWEKKETGFLNCMRAIQSSEGNLLVSCFVSGTDPDKTGNQLVDLDSQGNYLWKKNFVEKNDGIIYSMKPLDNGTYEVFLRGEGERKYTLDRRGNSLKEELLPARPDSFSHEPVPDVAFNAVSFVGNRTQVNVKELSGTNRVFIIEYPISRENLSGIYSVNPTSDGGYLVFSSAN